MATGLASTRPRRQAGSHGRSQTASEDARKHVGLPIDEVRVGEAALGDQPDVFRDIGVGRTGPLAIDHTVIVVGVRGICRFHMYRCWSRDVQNSAPRPRTAPPMAPDPQPLEIKFRRAARLLEVTFEDGSRFELPFEYLRVLLPVGRSQRARPRPGDSGAGQGSGRDPCDRAGRPVRREAGIRRRPRHRPLHLEIPVRARPRPGRRNGPAI